MDDVDAHVYDECHYERHLERVHALDDDEGGRRDDDQSRERAGTRPAQDVSQRNVAARMSPQSAAARDDL